MSILGKRFVQNLLGRLLAWMSQCAKSKSRKFRLKYGDACKAKMKSRAQAAAIIRSVYIVSHTILTLRLVRGLCGRCEPHSAVTSTSNLAAFRD